MKKNKKADQPPLPAPPKAPTHICPKCKTAVAPPDDTLAVIIPGYQGYHCLKCWGDILRQAVPLLVPLPPPAPAAKA